MSIADDIRPKNKKKKTRHLSKAPSVKRDEIDKENSKVKDDNFEININNVPKYSDDPFIFDHQDDTDNEETVDKEPEIKKTKKEATRNKKKRNPMTKWVVILVIVLVSLLVYQNYSYILDLFVSEESVPKEESEANSLYDNDYVSETEDTQSYDATTDERASSIETETSTTSENDTFERSSLNISVLNGNGITGSAKTVKTTLETAGYSVSNVSNALKFSYTNTTLYYNTGKSKEAEEMKDVLADRTCELYENRSVAGNYDIVVVVGAN